MSLIIFFGGVSVVIVVGLAVIIHGFCHYYFEAKKTN